MKLLRPTRAALVTVLGFVSVTVDAGATGASEARPMDEPELVTLAVTSGLIGVATAARVQIFDAAGRPLARLGPRPQQPESRTSAGAPPPQGEGHASDDGTTADRELLERLDVPPERQSSAAAEALLEDERTLGSARARRAVEFVSNVPSGIAPRGPLLAAAGDALWVLDGRRLIRFDGPSMRRSTTDLSLGSNDVDKIAVAEVERSPERPEEAPGESLVVMARGARLSALLVAHRDDGAHAPLVPFADADGAITRLAVLPGGEEVAWATASGLHRLRRAAARPERVDAAQVDDLRVCGGALVALAAGRLLVRGPQGSWQRTADAFETRRLGCAADGPAGRSGRARGGVGKPLLAIGAAVAISFDGGQTLRPLPLPPMGRHEAVAPAPDGVWRASSGGLDLWPWETLFGRGDAASVVTTAGGNDTSSAAASSGARRLHAAGRWLPRLVVEAAAGAAPGRTTWRGLVLAELPLGQPPLPPADALDRAPTLKPAFPRLAPGERACLEETRAEAVTRALVDPGRALSYVRRARRAGWLPEIRLRVEKSLGRSESRDEKTANTVNTTAQLGIDTDDDIRYEARATWDLARLVFSPEELAAQAHALRMADARQELESVINRLFFERRRLMMDLPTTAEEDASAELRRHVRIEELDAELDALSAGAFARCRDGARERTPR